MAYVKVHFVKHVQNVLNYIQREMGSQDLVDSYNCTPKKAPEQFQDIRTLHNGQGAVNGIISP
ncbi:MAG TPA: hypothetical protein VI895_01955 [Bdellovibrionota bacterium]|nr:hypothetical protein [Bdellovibrionota bacterium]